MELLLLSDPIDEIEVGEGLRIYPPEEELIDAELLEQMKADGIQEDFIEYWKKTMGKLTDAHWTFKEMVGLYLISTVTRWMWYFEDPREGSSDPLKPSGRLFNIWVCLLGKSRIAHKSTVIKKARQLIRNITYRIQDLNEEGIRESPDLTLILPDEFNASTFIHEMNQRNLNDFGGFSWATWIEDEVSRFFEQMQAQGYNAGLAPILSKLYDPYSGYSRSTRAHGVEQIEESYLTMVLASTEALPTLFTDYLLRQGFINRIMFAISDLKELEPSETFPPSTELEFTLMTDWLTAVRDINSPKGFLIDFKGEAREYVTKYEAYIDDLILEDKVDEIYQGYTGNLPIFMIQLACLYRISRMTTDHLLKGESWTHNLVWIELQDLERARKMVDILLENFQYIVRLARTKKVIANTYVQQSNHIVVYDSIVARTDDSGWAKRSAVLQKSSVKAKELEEIVSELDQIGCIKQKFDDKKKGSGRRAILYKAISPPY